MVENEKEHGSKDSCHNAYRLRIGRIGHCDWDLATNAMVWSPGMYSIFQLDPYNSAEDICLIHFLKWFHPDDRPKAREPHLAGAGLATTSRGAVPHCSHDRHDTECVSPSGAGIE